MGALLSTDKVSWHLAITGLAEGKQDGPLNGCKRGEGTPLGGNFIHKASCSVCEGGRVYPAETNMVILVPHKGTPA